MKANKTNSVLELLDLMKKQSEAQTKLNQVADNEFSK